MGWGVAGVNVSSPKQFLYVSLLSTAPTYASQYVVAYFDHLYAPLRVIKCDVIVKDLLHS